MQRDAPAERPSKARRPMSPRRSCPDTRTRTRRRTASAATAARPPRSRTARQRRCVSARSISTFATCGTGSLAKFLHGLLIEVVQPLAGIQSSGTSPRACASPAAAVPVRDRQAREGQDCRPRSSISSPATYVRIKSKEEIVATLDETSRNRGLQLRRRDGQLLRPDGRVRARVNRLVEESHRRDDRDQIRLHHPRGRHLRGRLLPVLHAGYLLRTGERSGSRRSMPPKTIRSLPPASRPAGAGCENRQRAARDGG